MGGVKRGEAGRVCGKSRDDNGPGTKHVCDQKCVQNCSGGGDLNGKDQPMRSSFFWDVTQRRLIVIYRRFGTTCRSRNVGITCLRCVMSQKSKDDLHRGGSRISPRRLVTLWN